MQNCQEKNHILFIIFAGRRGGSADVLRQADKGGADVAQMLPVGHHVPVLIAAVHRHAVAVGEPGRYRGLEGGGGAEVHRAAGDGGYLTRLGSGGGVGQAKVLREAQHQVGGDAGEILLDPQGVVGVVVVAQLQQHRGEPGLAYLSQRGGGPCGHLLRQGVDVPEVFHEQLRRPAAVGAGGIVEGENAPAPAPGTGAGGVGVEGQIEVVLSGVGLPDGGGGGHVRRIAGELDAVEQQNGLHGIGQQVHKVFL